MNKIQYSYFLGLYPLLYLISINQYLISRSSLVEITILFFSIILLIYILKSLLRLILDKTEKVQATIALIIFNFYLVKTVKHLIIGIILTFLIYYFLANKKKILLNVHKILVIMSLMLISMPIIKIISFSIDQFFQKEVTNSLEKKVHMPNKNELRDIYYIVLDGYGGANTLKKYLDFDNSNFLSFLRTNSFYINEKSNSNYNFTSFSIPSVLNMDYLSSFNIDINDYPSESVHKKINELMKNNKTKKYLDEFNYDYIMIPSTYSKSWRPDNLNFIFEENFIDYDIFNLYISKTIISRIKFAKNKIKEKWSDARRREILRQLAFLKKEVHDIDGPKFVFAHILSPHPPYVFNKNGSLAETKSDDGEWNYPEEYMNQIIYINKEIKIIVDNIIEKSRIDPIIIIESDTGPVLFEGETKMRLNINNLRAWHLPSFDKKLLNDELTSVNIFRIIFKNYFNLNIDLIEDKVFYLDFAKEPKKIMQIR
jgi:hypothetical protein